MRDIERKQQIEELRRVKEALKDLNEMEKKLYALNRLAEYHSTVFPNTFNLDASELVEVVATIISPSTNRYQKKAARILLNASIGKQEANKILEGEALITERSDPLVYRWKQEVLKRDNHTCQDCGAIEGLHVHHISHWANDIYNRINIDNGITLCASCHSKKHPNLKTLIKSTKGRGEGSE